jgi:hypothetical protein
MSDMTSCSPAPDAAAIPMRPRGTALAKPSGTPSRTAVPQSGPIISNDRSAAYRLSATSVSTGTLSLNIITCSPARNAFHASAPAYIPGTEISATFAPGSAPSAEPSVRGRGDSPPAAPVVCGAASAASAAARAPSAARSSDAMTATTRSDGTADSPSAASSPARRISARLCGVPIIAAARLTPSTASISRDRRISVTES